ncbi:MAG: helix-turn-helix domain-containing protein [Lachnospiraceae bacterium]|nr:helix-turn-helix domain-containing protein [Lachnospiraceae bacterium]
MNKPVAQGIESLFDLFADSISSADVLSAKLMAQVSNAITRERLLRDMSQTEFAESISVTQSMVSRWECGDYNFSLRKIAEVASKLNLNVDIDIRENPAEKPQASCEIINFTAARSRKRDMESWKMPSELEEM